MPLTSVFSERKTSVTKFSSANVAVSAGPFGTLLGTQLSPMFQSPSTSPVQLALSAKLDSIVRIKISAGKSPVMEVAKLHRSSLTVRVVILICSVCMGLVVVDGSSLRRGNGSRSVYLWDERHWRPIYFSSNRR